MIWPVVVVFYLVAGVVTVMGIATMPYFSRRGAYNDKVSAGEAGFIGLLSLLFWPIALIVGGTFWMGDKMKKRSAKANQK